MSQHNYFYLDLTLSNEYRYWIGLQIQNQTINWVDGTPYGYNNLNTSTVTSGELLAAYLTPGKQWIASSLDVQLDGRICKRPAIPNMPAIHNGSALGHTDAHDPTILKTQNGQYIVYWTDENIAASISNDRQTFTFNGTAFPDGLPWTANWTNGQRCYWTFEAGAKNSRANRVEKGTTTCVWAPDTSYHNGKYYMYYAASYLGSKLSAIGLGTSTTGRPGDWIDQGQVFNSTNESWNAIDPNLFVDDDGKWYLTFGSFSSGIWQYEMDPSTGFIKAGAQAVQLADNREGGIEASGLFKKGITSNNVRKRETDTCPTRS